MSRFPTPYWIIYYLAYLIAAAILLWLYWDGLLNSDGNTRIFLLAAVFGAAGGAAVAFTILSEMGVRAMLLIPAAVNKLKREGRMERDARYKEAYRRFGVEVDGVVMLPRTPEVQAFLDSESGQSDRSKD